MFAQLANPLLCNKTQFHFPFMFAPFSSKSSITEVSKQCHSVHSKHALFSERMTAKMSPLLFISEHAKAKFESIWISKSLRFIFSYSVSCTGYEMWLFYLIFVLNHFRLQKICTSSFTLSRLYHSIIVFGFFATSFDTLNLFLWDIIIQSSNKPHSSNSSWGVFMFSGEKKKKVNGIFSRRRNEDFLKLFAFFFFFK